VNDVTSMVNAMVDWEFLGEQKAGFKIPGTGIEVVQARVLDCDHETCYETHDIIMVVKFGDRYFGKVYEYSSYDGWEVRDGLTELFPKSVTTTTYEVSP